MRIIHATYIAILICFVFTKIYWHNCIIRLAYRLAKLENLYTAHIKQIDHLNADYACAISWEQTSRYAKQQNMSIIPLKQIITIECTAQPLERA